MQNKTFSISLGSRLLNQCSKPSGWLGRVNLWNMNHRHSKVTAWGLQHISIGKGDTILDVGCGGGATIVRLAARADDGKTYGIDYSEESVAASRKTNHKLLAAGRVEVVLGSVSHLPFPDEMFDLVTAVETHYYWPDLQADMQEVLRVLKPGGRCSSSRKRMGAGSMTSCCNAWTNYAASCITHTSRLRSIASCSPMPAIPRFRCSRNTTRAGSAP